MNSEKDRRAADLRGQLAATPLPDLPLPGDADAAVARARSTAQRWLDDLQSEDLRDPGIRTARNICQQILADLNGAW